jgi:hypothetical protein
VLKLLVQLFGNCLVQLAAGIKLCSVLNGSGIFIISARSSLVRKTRSECGLTYEHIMLTLPQFYLLQTRLYPNLLYLNEVR